MDEESSLYKALYNLERTLSQVQEKLKDSHVLNGGFDRLMEQVAKIEQTQDKILDEVNTIKDTIYDPDDGLYSRIRSTSDKNIGKVHDIDKSMSELKVKYEKDIEILEKLEKDIDKLENLSIKIDDISRWKETINKILLALTVPSITAIVKLLYDIINNTHK